MKEGWFNFGKKPSVSEEERLANLEEAKSRPQPAPIVMDDNGILHDPNKPAEVQKQEIKGAIEEQREQPIEYKEAA